MNTTDRLNDGNGFFDFVIATVAVTWKSNKKQNYLF